MPKHESVSLALAGRLLKYGQSVAVTLPQFNGEAIARLLVYLHRLRFDALEGAVRAPWLNRANLIQRPHLVFISRPQERMRDCSRVPEIHARIPRLGVPSHGTNPAKAQTLVLNGSADVMVLVEFLRAEAKPFALVLDGTVNGCDAVGELESALAEALPNIPRVVLFTLGNPEADRRFAASRSLTHHWRIRETDRALLDEDIQSRQLEITTTADVVADSELRAAAAHYFTLKAEMERSSDIPLKKKLLVLGKILRALTEAVVPVDILEGRLQRVTRGGLYPIRSLERWIEVAQGGETCAHGSTQSSVDQLTRHLADIRTMLVEGLSGRSSALLSKASSFVKAHEEGTNGTARLQRTLLVLCGSAQESLSIEEWFDAHLADTWRDVVSVSAMDGVSSRRVTQGRVNEVVITGTLWPSRQHWLATPCEKLQLLCHPFEVEPMERLLGGWWKRYGCQSDPEGDKATLWTLGWREGVALRDEAVRCADALLIKRTTEKYTGHYPKKPRAVALPIYLKLDDWLEQLTAQPVEPDEGVKPGETLSTDHVLIHTAEYSEPIPWRVDKSALIMDHTGLNASKPDLLQAGQRILLLKYTDERVATQERLFEVVAREDEGLHQALKFASRWDEMVDVVSKKHSPRNIQLALKAVNVPITEQAIRNWFNHGVIGPRSSEVVRLFARMSGAQDPDRVARYTVNGIEIVRSAHLTLGAQIRKALMERGGGATDIRIGTLHVGVETLDEMMELVTVTRVEVPTPRVVIAERSPNLHEVAQDVRTKYDGRLAFTRPATKSMRDSGYRDLEKFRSCLEVMGTHLFDHFNNRTTRLHEVLDHFKGIGVEYAPLMSDTTTGRYGDDRRYKGRQADMNKHFILGRARDQTKTLRIHFEWDDEDKLIVIHHAGEHLKTTQS